MLFQSRRVCPVCKTPGNHWCTTQDWEYRSTSDEYTYLKCPLCHTLFLEELKEERLLSIYPPHYYSFSKEATNSLFKLKDWWDTRFYKSLLKKNLSEKLSVLDVGGGTGQVSDVLKAADNRIYYTEIIDIDKTSKDFAEQKGHVYTCVPFESYCTKKKFDVILLLNIIEHVADPIQLIEKAGTMLSDNGIIIIKTPNANSLDARLFRKQYWGGLHAPRHWIIFTENSFKFSILNKDLKIETIKYTQGAAFWAYSVINLFRKKDIHQNKKNLLESPFFTPLSTFFAIFDMCRSYFSATSQMFIILRK